jgi:hypothetical protein
VNRLAVADRLDRRVDGWIRTAREDIFAPIGKEVMELWSILNPDADLKLTGIALTGGTKLRRSVALNLADGDVALPTGKNSSAVLSTGQRNALSLATYLPRATQPESPFGFLILDDPIHAFDTGRVRYLAQHLMTLAERFQVVVFTHDDRLWRELRGLRRPGPGTGRSRYARKRRTAARHQPCAAGAGRGPAAVQVARRATTRARCRWPQRLL